MSTKLSDHIRIFRLNQIDAAIVAAIDAKEEEYTEADDLLDDLDQLRGQLRSIQDEIAALEAQRRERLDQARDYETEIERLKGERRTLLEEE